MADLRRSKAVLFNGPPGAGKDTAADLLKVHAQNPLVAKFSGILKERTHALYGLFEHTGRPLPHDHFEPVKEKPCDEFLGLSPREAYIAVSEDYFRPKHGRDVYAKLLANDLRAFVNGHTLILSDCGFADECGPFLESLDIETALVVHIYREGHDFEGDSRSYIHIPGVPTVRVDNPGNTCGFERELLDNIPREYYR